MKCMKQTSFSRQNIFPLFFSDTQSDLKNKFSPDETPMILMSPYAKMKKCLNAYFRQFFVQKTSFKAKLMVYSESS
jgi:hypothetical protein